jgi:hypothetical protein
MKTQQKHGQRFKIKPREPDWHWAPPLLSWLSDGNATCDTAQRRSQEECSESSTAVHPGCLAKHPNREKEARFFWNERRPHHLNPALSMALCEGSSTCCPQDGAQEGINYWPALWSKAQGSEWKEYYIRNVTRQYDLMASKKQKEMSGPISNERPPCNVSRGDIWWDQCHPPSGSFCSLLTNHEQRIPGLQTENKERPRKFHC